MRQMPRKNGSVLRQCVKRVRIDFPIAINAKRIGARCINRDQNYIDFGRNEAGKARLLWFLMLAGQQSCKQADTTQDLMIRKPRGSIVASFGGKRQKKGGS